MDRRRRTRRILARILLDDYCLPVVFNLLGLGCLLHRRNLPASREQNAVAVQLGELLGLVSWFAAHCGAWRLSFIWMLEEYSQLPTTEPNRCFVCTAAARGHRRVVHGEDYRAPNGSLYRVNDQLRILKAFELLLLSTSPHAHCICRRVYDRVGPMLAAVLVHPAGRRRLLRPQTIRMDCAHLPGHGDTRQKGFGLSPLRRAPR